jgi:hypothetical protein
LDKRLIIVDPEDDAVGKINFIFNQVEQQSSTTNSKPIIVPQPAQKIPVKDHESATFSAVFLKKAEANRSVAANTVATQQPQQHHVAPQKISHISGVKEFVATVKDPLASSLLNATFASYPGRKTPCILILL